MATSTVTSLSNVKYANQQGSNELKANIGFDYETIFTEPRSNKIRWRLQIRDGETNALIGSDEITETVTDQFTDKIVGSFVRSFTIPQGADFPTFVKANLGIWIMSSNTQVINLEDIDFDIPFSGTQPEDPVPTNQWVTVEHDQSLSDGFKLLDGQLTGLIIAKKTSAFDEFLNNQGLHIIMIVKDSFGNEIEIQDHPFIFGTNDTKQQLIVVNGINVQQVTVELFVRDNSNFEWSLHNELSFFEEGQIPPGTENISIIATAEDGATIQGVVTQTDFNFLQSSTGVITLNGLITGFTTGDNIDLNANLVMNFIGLHQVTPGPNGGDPLDFFNNLTTNQKILLGISALASVGLIGVLAVRRNKKRRGKKR